MKKLLTILMLSAAVCLGATAKPSAQKPIKPATSAQLKTFVSLYAKSDSAMMRGDARYLNAILAPDFASRAFSGRTSNRAQRVRNVTMLFRKIKINASTTAIERLGFRGKQALTVVLGDGTFVMSGVDGKPHRIRLVVRSTDTWISTNRGWLLQSTVETQGRQFIDGREVPIGQKL